MSESSPVDLADSPLRRKGTPVKEIRENDQRMLWQFWHNDVLGEPNSETAQLETFNTPDKQVDYLFRSYKKRVKVLAGELGIKSLSFDQKQTVANIPFGQIQNFAGQFLTEEDKTLNNAEKDMVKNWLKTLQTSSLRTDLTQDEINQHQGSRERFYMFLISRQSKAIARSSCFDFLPNEAAKYKTRSCLTATAIGYVLAEEAGIECERLSVTDHVVLGIHTKDHQYRGIDMNNYGRDWRLTAGEPIYGLPTYKLLDVTENKGNPYRIIIRQQPQVFIEAIFDNLHFNLEKHDQQLEDLLKESISPEEDRKTYFALKHKYGINFFDKWQKQLFGKTHPYYLSKEAKEENERVRSAR